MKRYRLLSISLCVTSITGIITVIIATIGTVLLNGNDLMNAFASDVSMLLLTKNCCIFINGFYVASAIIICIGLLKYWLMHELNFKYPLSIPIIMFLCAVGLIIMASLEPSIVHFVGAIFGIIMLITGQIMDALQWRKYVKQNGLKYSCIFHAFSLSLPIIAMVCFMMWIVVQIVWNCGSIFEWIGVFILMFGYLTQIMHAMYANRPKFRESCNSESDNSQFCSVSCESNHG